MFYLFIPFVVLLFVYCLFEKRDNFLVATILKVLLSAFVAGVAVYSAIVLNKFEYYLIALGLVFAVPADYFLQYIKSNLKKYRLGILSFGAMHVCLLVGFYLNWSAAWQEIIILMGFLSLLSIFQKLQKWDLGKAKFQLSIYTVLVTLMAAKSISIAINFPSPATILLGIGGLFFFVSDLFLGIWDYYKNKFVYLALNRAVYFTGQILIAFCLVLSIA